MPPLDLFAEAEAAFEIEQASMLADAFDGVGDGGDSDEEDGWGNNVKESRARELRLRVVRLPDGDIHVCGCDCEYGIFNPKEGNVVCQYTGVEVGRRCAERTDCSTGRSTWSVDPDVNCGGPMGGVWRKKRDMKKESNHAFISASTMDDTEMPRAVHASKAARLPSKRGALCVDEEAPLDTGPKRQRVSKKDVDSHATRIVLMEEATATFSKLLGSSSFVSKASARVVDPRLLNRELLFTAALKKYLKTTLSSGGAPSLDDVHNIALAVDAVITAEKRKMVDAAACGRGGRIASISFRQRAAALAVALWTGACKTTYLSKARRGADSFKPFCAGVFYAMKRGLTLPDGTVLVPKCAEFADALPAARAAATDQVSKSLHAASHRGLCTIHRAIAATAHDAQSAKQLFAEAVRAAKGF